MQKIIYNQSKIAAIAASLLQEASSKTLCFYGDMGAGKTTLIKAMLLQLGAEDAGNSPTFGIVNEYHLPNGTVLAYHFDFYRLQDELEALDLGLEDYLNQDQWLFIEWPEKIPSLLPTDHTKVFLEVMDEETRAIWWD